MMCLNKNSDGELKQFRDLDIRNLSGKVCKNYEARVCLLSKL